MSKSAFIEYNCDMPTAEKEIRTLLNAWKMGKIEAIGTGTCKVSGINMDVLVALEDLPFVESAEFA